MVRKINYEDDIFYLLLFLKRLHEGVKLDIDPEFFLDRVVDDIFFIDETVAELYRSISQSSLINKDQYLRDIQRVKKLMVERIEDILSRRAPLSGSLENFMQSFGDLCGTHRRDILDIKSILAGLSGESDEEEQMVSEKEIKLLLSDQEKSQQP